MNIVPRRLLWSALLGSVLIGTVAGCGESVATVTGEVKVNDKPVPDGVITFASQNKRKRVLTGTIKDGKYSVAEVPVGETLVSVKESAVLAAPPPGKGSKAVPPAIKAPSLVPSKYSDPKTSGLTYTVKSGENVYNPTIQSDSPKKK